MEDLCEAPSIFYPNQKESPQSRHSSVPTATLLWPTLTQKRHIYIQSEDGAAHLCGSRILPQLPKKGLQLHSFGNIHLGFTP